MLSTAGIIGLAIYLGLVTVLAIAVAVADRKGDQTATVRSFEGRSKDPVAVGEAA